MKRIKFILILILLTMSMEVVMATGTNKTMNAVKGNARVGKGMSANSGLLRSNMGAVNADQTFMQAPKKMNASNGEEGFDIGDIILNAAVGGAANNPVLGGAATGGALPAWLAGDKDMDAMKKKRMMQAMNRERMMQAMSREREMQAMKRGSSFIPNGDQSGFATGNYGGNWGGGGGGGYEDTPAWWNNYMRLNSWNIG